MGLSLRNTPALAQSSGTATTCAGTVVVIPNAEKKLMPVGERFGRPGDCVVPHKIVLHTTEGPQDAQGIWDFFAAGQGVNSHFIIGTDGKVLQGIEMLSDKVEVAYAVLNYRDDISIEMVFNGDYTNKAAVPAAQYAATYILVQDLMKQYAIPLSSNDCHWKTGSDAFDPSVPAGVYGHLQLNPETKKDPGLGMLCDILDDLKNKTGPTSTTSTGTAPTSSGSAGRLVPYDAYARPYSWPMTGKIRQAYGFTEEAANLGLRYPGLYPKGDPGVVFSTTSLVEPLPNLKNDRFINPNIDIEPNAQDAGARAVYATHAGWLTFADWAGESKGYTIQIESDIEGDGQADLATRYMHLQAPASKFFAPDVPVYRPADGPKEPAPTVPIVPTTPPLPPPTIMEAEGMTRSSDDMQIVPDKDASNGQAVLMKKNGVLSQILDKRADRVVIKARGDQCRSLFGADTEPQMVVKLDGVITQTFKVSTDTGWGDYAVDIVADGAKHPFSLSFTNYTTGLGCERRLWVDVSQFSVFSATAPTAKTLDDVPIEVESLTTLEGKNKPTVIDDATAKPDPPKQGQYIAFLIESKVSGKVVIKNGNWISVTARAQKCNGTAPHMVVSIDGKEVFGVDVTSEDWQDYSTSFSLPQAQGDTTNSTEHEVSVAFAPDNTPQLINPFCKRTLQADIIHIQNNTATQTTAQAASLIGKTKYIARNQLIGYVSSDRSYEKAGIDLSKVPEANQTYLSYRIMYNNPNTTTFPQPDGPDSFINARVDNPYIVETPNNTVAGSLKTIFDEPTAQMFFFCANRVRGNAVRCIYAPNPL